MVESDFSLSASTFSRLDNALTGFNTDWSKRYFSGDKSTVEKGESYDLLIEGKTFLENLNLNYKEFAGIGYTFSDDINRIEEKFMELASASGGISEKIAELRGLKQVSAGGEYEVDQDINDLNDAFAGLGITKLDFVKSSNNQVESQESNKSVGSQNNDMINNLMEFARENKVLLAGAGIIIFLVME